MDETNVIPLVQPGQIDDALTEVLRDGAQRPGLFNAFHAVSTAIYVIRIHVAQKV